MASISIILTTFNKVNSLERTLASLENQNSFNFELNILDDGSSDETLTFCKKYVFLSSLPCRYIRVEKEGNNVALLRNVGAHISGGKFLVFLDDDIVVRPEFIEQYLSHFQENPDNIYLGKLLYINTKEASMVTPDDIKNRNFMLLENGLFSRFDPRVDTLKELPDYYKVWSGNLGIMKKTFCSINGFDEDFRFWGGKDLDLGYRLKRAGYKLILLNDCEGYHMGANFLPFSEIQNQIGVRLFEDYKINDPTIIRNTKVKKEGNFPVTIIYDGSKFQTDLLGEQ